jgi:hypothetical protein
MTRPRPGIDRVSSAWFITRFIDPNATFVFGKDPSAQEGAIPFDIFRLAVSVMKVTTVPLRRFATPFE